MSKRINKNIFFTITEKYYSSMKLHDMLLLYYKIIDLIYPNYIPKLNNKNVFTRLYTSRRPPFRSCCNEHTSLYNLQKNIKRHIVTDHDKKRYYRACCFFRHLQLEILKELQMSTVWFEYMQKINFLNRNEIKHRIITSVKKRLNNWEGIRDIIKFNRKGKIIKLSYDLSYNN